MTASIRNRNHRSDSSTALNEPFRAHHEITYINSQQRFKHQHGDPRFDYQRRQLRTSQGQRCVGTRDSWSTKVTGAFMQITSTSDSKLVSAQADVAGRVEIHTMEMDKDVMKMRKSLTLICQQIKP